jgi:site-specific DNA-methyltransferase (adenine-specific)
LSFERVEIGDCILYRGDALEVLPTLTPDTFDGVITDPPYSSGGAFRGDRVQKTVAKYVNSDSGQKEFRSEFSGDSRDQRSFFAWCSLWMLAARRACAPGAVLCSFIDWRQLPVMTDSVQAGGWVWRNLATWWKPGCRMQRGRFSSSAEFVVYATNGPHDGEDGECSPQNVFACQPVSGEDKTHIAEKPVDVMAWAMSVSRPKALMLDPFMGTGTALVAALRSGRAAVGIEIDPFCFDIACKRVEEANGKGGLFQEAAETADLFRDEAAGNGAVGAGVRDEPTPDADRGEGDKKRPDAA